MIDPNQIGEGELSEEQLIYRENILDHYKHPRNKHALQDAVKHQERNPLCGDTITAYLKIQEGRIVDVGFEGNGCAISQASMSMLTERLKGMTLEEIKRLGQAQVTEMLGIPIGIVRMKCAMLGLRTTQEAITHA